MMEISADLVYTERGIPLICEQFFEQYRALHGCPPGRNYMMGHSDLAEVGEHQVRIAWEVLVGKRRAAPRRHKPYRKRGSIVTAENGQHEAASKLLEAEAHDSEAAEEDQITAVAVGLVKQQQDYAALAHDVQQLRELIMALPTSKVPPLPAELATAVGRLQADGARRDTQMQRLHDRVDELTRLVAALEQALAPFRQWWRLLCEDDDAWASWRSIVRTGSPGTQKKLLAFFIEKTGHQFETNDKASQ
jgi:polyhydroxyalkanoate synthesis regulator phasin